MVLHRLLPLMIVFLLLMPACNEPESPGGRQAESSEPDKLGGVILLIGDGMGLAQVSTNFYYGEGEPNFSRFKHIGLINTSSSAEKVTDSASSATAYSTGQRTYNGAIGVGPDTADLETIVEQVSTMGWATGVVATSSIVHATPAAFYAHVPLRSMYDEIARQLVQSDIDFFAGGGTRFFFRRGDGQDLSLAASDAGFQLDTTGLDPEVSFQADAKYGFLLADDGMPPMLNDRGDFLPDATTAALKHLSQNEEGFFLMVEGSQIDWGGHANVFEYLATEVEDFDNAIGVALDFAEERGDILVVVTADHETGGLSLSASETEGYQEIGPTFSTGGHSATLIPVFAYGPGAENFAGIYDNTGIYDRMAELIGIEPAMLSVR